jgi:hypothetical protein
VEGGTLDLAIDAIRDDSLNGWLLTPVGALVTFLAKEMVISGVTHRALIGAQIIPILLETVKNYAPAQNEATQLSFQKLIELSTADNSFAKEEIENGFNTICSHHAITTWLLSKPR